MGIEVNELAAAIGARVKHERTKKSWTLDQLATAAGVSRRMVVNIEQAATNPSIATLLRISDALGVGLPALVEPPSSPDIKLVRAGHGATLWQGAHGGRGILLVGTRAPDVVELWDWHMEPGERHVSEAHSAGTQELLRVDSGTLTVEVAGSTYELNEGDSVGFPGDEAHAYANNSAAPTQFTLTVFEPQVGTVAAKEEIS